MSELASEPLGADAEPAAERGVGVSELASEPSGSHAEPAAERAVSEQTQGMTRNTRQRAQVLALLAETDEFRSAQQLHSELRTRGAAVGLTTVYRTLQVLADAGQVDQMRLPAGEQLYRRCAATEHHHHLVCRSCGRTVEVAGPAVETWAEKLAAEHGFTDVAHTLEIFGTCAACSRPVGGRGRRAGR